jgi:5-methylcytosine-specific restriction endonuclease McrA
VHKDPEVGRQYKHDYHLRNKERLNAKSAAYRISHAEELRADRQVKMRRPQDQYRRLKNEAKRREYEVTITFEDFLLLRCIGSCDYCGDGLPEIGHGIDRKDNSFGYIIGNCVPCCTICNETKGEHLSYDEMHLIIKYRRDHGTA